MGGLAIIDSANKTARVDSGGGGSAGAAGLLLSTSDRCVPCERGALVAMSFCAGGGGGRAEGEAETCRPRKVA